MDPLRRGKDFPHPFSHSLLTPTPILPSLVPAPQPCSTSSQSISHNWMLHCTFICLHVHGRSPIESKIHEASLILFCTSRVPRIEIRPGTWQGLIVQSLSLV